MFNEGAGPASQVQLRVKIPTVATYRGFFAPDYPLFSQLYDASTGEYVFTTSGLAGGQSRTITVVDSNHCNLSSVGQHHCIQAYVRYGGKCFLNLPNWDRSDLVVRSQCLPDGQAGFHVQNRGMGSMADSSNFRLLSAQGVARTGRLKLNAGESTWLSAAAPGQFLQLQVEQRAHHPIGNVSSAIGLPCGAPPVPGPTLPFATGQESNEESVTLCREVRNSFDPNDKQVWPAGWGEAGNVANGTELHYRIRFENMGNAPAHFVQIRDTLSPHLNPGSLRHLNSSHNEDLRFTVEGTFEAPVLVFTFPSIVLPDSGSDKIKSEGFVSFSISPKPGLAQQTAIRNRAFITFDIYTPIETNTTLSTINDSLPVGPPIVVGLAKARHPEALRLQPNPTRDKVDIVFSEAGWGEIRVFDTQGKCLFTQSVRGTGRVAWTAPNSGLYLVRFEKRDGSLEVGRLVVE